MANRIIPAPASVTWGWGEVPLTATYKPKMKAIKHKPTGKWLICDDSDEYILSDECYPFTSFGTDEQIAEEVEIISDGEYMADDIEVVTVHVLTDADLETIRREAFEAGRATADQYIMVCGNFIMPPKYPTADDYINSLKEEESK